MILKLGLKHQAMKLYKVYINHDPGMTLTCFTTRSTSVGHTFEWGKLLQCHLKGKTCSKLANGLNLYDLKKKLTQVVALTLPWGYIHVYYHSSQTSLLVFISGERLQDHWSSGFAYTMVCARVSSDNALKVTSALSYTCAQTIK